MASSEKMFCRVHEVLNRLGMVKTFLCVCLCVRWSAVSGFGHGVKNGCTYSVIMNAVRLVHSVCVCVEGDLWR